MITRLLQIGLVLTATHVVTAEPVDFNRDIRPILNERCTSCHGGVKRKGGFSLLYRSETLKPAKSGDIPVVPGKPEDSAIYHRITSGDPDDQMPPKGDRLSDKQVALLKQWIKDGAPYAEHWAYVKPTKQDAPTVKNKKWARNHIDPFILQRLESEALTPAPEAPKETLLRRLHLDLVGLPPSAADYDRFMADTSPEAYEKEVDRLLQSPHFGERWASMWLDLARYADTQGYEKDNARSISPYRDWVIDAFNRDPGYDTFTIEQLAGDMLPKATDTQRVATGFHRNTMNNTEGGTLNEEFRVAAVLDRVNTTWEVWMATSFSCVQCHNHPYDPFLQTEYYQFMDFLNHTEDEDRDNDAPTLTVKTMAEKAKIADIQKEIDALKAELDKAAANTASEQEKWEETLRNAPQWMTPTPTTAVASKPDVTMTVKDDKSILVGGERPKEDQLRVSPRVVLSSPASSRSKVNFA